MTPQTEDIVMAMFNSTVVAFDGLTYKQLWSWHSDQPAETYATPAVGRFNADATPDFFISYQYGPGFPLYYYTHAQVIDGRTGRELLKEPIEMLVGSQSSPLTISTTGNHDLFLFWFSSCANVTGSDINAHLAPKNLANQELSFNVAPGTNVHEQSRADFCQLRWQLIS